MGKQIRRRIEKVVFAALKTSRKDLKNKMKTFNAQKLNLRFRQKHLTTKKMVLLK